MSDVLADRRAANHASLHGAAAERVAALDQRYTASRRALVHALLEAERPLTITEILAGAKGMPQSSAYRNLTVLCEAGVARRLPGVDDLGRFELAEDLAQETFVRVYRARDRYQRSYAFSTYIYRIATNLAISELRKRKRRKLVSLTGLATV